MNENIGILLYKLEIDPTFNFQTKIHTFDIILISILNHAAKKKVFLYI